MKSKNSLGVWFLLGVMVTLFLVFSLPSRLSVPFLIVIAALFANWSAFFFQLARYYYYGVPVRRLENKARYRVIEQTKTQVIKDECPKYDFHLKLVNLEDNKTRSYLLEHYIPIFDSNGRRLDHFPDAFELVKTREWKCISGEPWLITLYQVTEIPCP